MKKKICIVVDHISRDLAGYIYLVSKFDKKKYDFYLVPFYNFREIYFIMPDMVILNHSRWIYKNFIKILNNLNISIFILDTEGGMITKDLIKEYYLFSEIKKNINYVDGYLIWSQKIKKEILLFDKKLKKYNKKLIVTGNPRFNYLLSQKKKKLGTNILLNFNFATIDPKYSTFQNEKKLLIKQGKSRGWVRRYCKDQFKMRSAFILLAKKLEKEKIINKIVIRPHPYENLSNYSNIFKNNKKIIINFDTDLKREIYKSLLVIQNNCSTSIDAILLGRKSIYYQPFKSKYLDQKLFLKLSMVCKSYEDIINKIKYYRDKNNIRLEKEINVINNEFSDLKNNLKELIWVVSQSRKDKIINNKINLIIILLRNNEIFFYFKTLLKIFLGKKLSFFYNQNLLKKIVTKDKIFEIISENKSLKNFYKKKVINIKKFLFFDCFSIEIKS